MTPFFWFVCTLDLDVSFLFLFFGFLDLQASIRLRLRITFGSGGETGGENITDQTDFSFPSSVTA